MTLFFKSFVFYLFTAIVIVLYSCCAHLICCTARLLWFGFCSFPCLQVTKLVNLHRWDNSAFFLILKVKKGNASVSFSVCFWRKYPNPRKSLGLESFHSCNSFSFLHLLYCNSIFSSVPFSTWLPVCVRVCVCMCLYTKAKMSGTNRVHPAKESY